MINLRSIFKIFDIEGEYKALPDTQFDHDKDFIFETDYSGGEGTYIANINMKNNKSLICTFSNKEDLDKFDFDFSAELLNGQVHGRVIHWNEWNDYSEFKNGVLDGYCENTHQQYLGERGCYKDGLQDGWWEYGDIFSDDEYGSNDFHQLENYRAASFALYKKGIQLGCFKSVDSDSEYELAVIREGYWTNRLIRDAIEQEEIYRGQSVSYFSYAMYLKITNLPALIAPSNETVESKMYSHCARAIDYDDIYNQYKKIMKSTEFKPTQIKLPSLVKGF